MAKMIAEFDTETKSLTCSIDGVAIDNVRMVEMGPSWDEDDEFMCSFMTKSTHDETGITHVTRMYASETKAAKSAMGRKDGKAYPSKALPGFVEDHDSTSKSKVHNDIAEAFGCKE